MEGIDLGRRGNLDVIASILNACPYWTSKTHVMYQSNMSSTQFTDYLYMLLNANLVLMENNNHSLLFKISDKGKYFLKTYAVMKNMLR